MSWETYSPLIGDVSCGAVGGFCIGYSAKKIAKVIAFIFGAWLMSLQILASRRLITINYNQFYIAGDTMIKSISQVGLSLAPLGLSFTGGLALGLKKG